MSQRLYIGNVAPAVTEADLRSFFGRAGKVVEVQIMVDASGQSRGFAFVTMATAEAAALAQRDLHACDLAGRNISVTEARPPQAATGLMSEGFVGSTSSGFRPPEPRAKKHHRMKRSSR